MKHIYCLVVLFFLLVISCENTHAQNKVFVSLSGSDLNEGTLDKPLRTIAKAQEHFSADTIYLLEGYYHEEVVFSNFSGTKAGKKVISAFANQKVVMDGTDTIRTPWEKYSGNIYKTTLEKDVWQLFVGDEMLMPARWPNAFLSDGSVWDRNNNWAHGDATTGSNGVMVDAAFGNNVLANLDVDLTGAIAIMNIGSWKTYARKILSHEKGSNSFTYEEVKGYKSKHHYYYLEGKLEFLDAPGEWFYDVDSKELYVWLPDGSKPGNNLRGKVQSYAFNFSNCQNVHLKDIDFFGTTFNFSAAKNVLVENCNLNFPSCSRRAVNDLSGALVTSVVGSTAAPSENVVLNCEIRNTESHGIYMKGNSDRLENCLFENIDWVVADRPQLMNSVYVLGFNNIIRRNTIFQCGASSTLSPGNSPLIEFNNISKTGFLQSDGSLVQLKTDEQPGSITRYNWFHNTVKMGARFDAPIPPVRWGNSGVMHHNAIWETGNGLMLKGERHFCFNNSAFKTANNGIIIFDDSKDNGGANAGTLTHNNFSDKISGERSISTSLPGVASHNWNGYEKNVSFETQINDYNNMDFRPLATSELVDAGLEYPGYADKFLGNAPDIGAYEFGDSVYWIAGRKTPKASMPIPGSNFETSSEYVDLMWLEAYKAVSHNIYFGESRAAVENAGLNAPEFKKTQRNNIFNPGELKASKTYYWRVDANMPDGKVIKGDVWHFTVGIDANIFTGIKEDRLNENIKIYPNPTSGILNLELATNNSLQFKVLTLAGIVVKQEQSSGIFTQIETNDLIPGIYILSVADTNSRIAFIKQ
ncbi:MAG: T9SS type A sorting domain-containing protein [Prolixibacteraceae bacterium]|nr:T9SS type A sorting domain-containing protein [Prolixibacteraceae bacterium]